MATTASRPVDPARVEEMLGRFTTDLGAAFSFPLVLVGEQLGLFTAMEDGEPVTAAALAGRTGTDERHLQDGCRRWRPAATSRWIRRPAGSIATHLIPEWIPALETWVRSCSAGLAWPTSAAATAPPPS